MTGKNDNTSQKYAYNMFSFIRHFSLNMLIVVMLIKMVY